MQDRILYNILYSCTDEAKRGHEPFVAEHALCWIRTGEMELHTSSGVLSFGEGTVGVLRRNQLVKAVKKPGADGPFLSVSVILDRASLQRYAAQHGVHPTGPYTGPALVRLQADPFLKGYFDSLMPYFTDPAQLTVRLAELKTDEALTLLLRHLPMRELLFDAAEPFKIDLEAYMNRHFTYNVPLARFAELTGRSLSTFKRDFAKVFHEPPEQWLRRKRLEQAHFLLTQEKRRPTDVYLDVGFENLSHFSTAYKRHFGVNASEAVGEG